VKPKSAVNKMKKFILLTSILFVTIACFTQSITGRWKTNDPFTNKPSSIVEIYFNDGKLYGKLVEVFDQDNPETAICQDCPGDWKNKPIIGLVVLNGLERDGDKWSGTNAFFSRKKKKSYTGSVWVDGNKLKIQLKLGPIRVTRGWTRAN